MYEEVLRAFSPSTGPRRIGIELEMHVRTMPFLSDELLRRGRPSREPGGQLELSPPPQTSVTALLGEVDWCLRSLGESTDVALTGVDPWRVLDEVPLVLPTARYLSMQALFDHHGDAGRRMMRLTASLQVCVDLLPGSAGREQWLVANLAGPALVAAFGGSPERTRIWQGMDPVRTGYDGRHLDVDDPIAAYAGFARSAERLPIPEADDDAYHLGTIFPPVRPRGGYLELRYLDSQRPTHVLLQSIWALMYDERIRRAAYELLLPTLPTFAEQWHNADPEPLLALVGSREVAA